MNTGQLFAALARNIFGSKALGGTGRRTFRIALVANGFDSSNVEMDHIKMIADECTRFYSSIADLKFTITHKHLVPKYMMDPTFTQGPCYFCEFDWYDTNISIPHLADADIVMFVTPRPTSPVTYGGIMTFANCGPWETTVFAGPMTDHGYIGTKDLGNNNALIAKHELSHAFYRMMNTNDNLDHTHPLFYGGTPEKVLEELSFPPLTTNQIIGELGRKLAGAMVALGLIEKYRGVVVVDPKDEHPEPAPAPVPPPAPAALAWDSPEHVRHSIRVKCDKANFDVPTKNEFTACVYQESQFNPLAIGSINSDGTQDFGLCQYNNGTNDKGVAYWIGPGAAFSTVNEVFSNPEKNVDVMIAEWKRGEAGKRQWSSYKTGAYKKWLPYVATPVPASGHY